MFADCPVIYRKPLIRENCFRETQMCDVYILVPYGCAIAVRLINRLERLIKFFVTKRSVSSSESMRMEGAWSHGQPIQFGF